MYTIFSQKWNLRSKNVNFSTPNANFEKIKVGPDRKMAADSKDIFTVPVLQTDEELCQLR